MKEGAVKKDYTVPALFITAVTLVFVFLVVNLIFGGKKYPSIKDGATTSQVEEYAYKLLEKDDGTNNLGYNEAVAYYVSQIAASNDKEQKFNLMLDFAIFYGKTGDPSSGLQVLGDVDENIPPDAKYYLYTTYIYLYERLNDDAMATEYRQKIVDEKIADYFAGLDNGTIAPEDFKTEEPVEEEPEVEPEKESEPVVLESLFNVEGL
ncbi:MAG: hypothetical protein Q4A25_00725 [Candidatus Saccharibacteria bacterium]|nr:hypothetical protein [Candidatus Saccharibacteria bacterium]